MQLVQSSFQPERVLLMYQGKIEAGQVEDYYGKSTEEIQQKMRLLVEQVAPESIKEKRDFVLGVCQVVKRSTRSDSNYLGKSVRLRSGLQKFRERLDAATIVCHKVPDERLKEALMKVIAHERGQLHDY